MASPRNIIAFGATSAICTALLRRYATVGARLYLIGRSADKLEACADDLAARGADVVGSSDYDFNDNARHTSALENAIAALGEVDLVIVAHGSLPEQADCEQDDALVAACMDDNFTSAAVIMHAAARQLAQQGRGTLAVISSVAGDRGRKSNYTYGAAKAGLDAVAQGMQGRFNGTDIRVVNIKPGMVASPMTAHMDQGPLFASPEAIAPRMQRAIERGSRVVYVPGVWRYIMWVIRLLPTAVLARLPI